MIVEHKNTDTQCKIILYKSVPGYHDSIWHYRNKVVVYISNGNEILIMCFRPRFTKLRNYQIKNMNIFINRLFFSGQGDGERGDDVLMSNKMSNKWHNRKFVHFKKADRKYNKRPRVKLQSDRRVITLIKYY